MAKAKHYRFLRSEPYVNRYGARIELHVYEGQCRGCGDPFEVRTRDLDDFSRVVVRCAECRAGTSRSLQMKARWERIRAAGGDAFPAK